MGLDLISNSESGLLVNPLDSSELKGEIPQGKLYRKKLEPYMVAVALPTLEETLAIVVSQDDPAAKEKRRILMRKLIRNAPNNFPLVGKPSSSFLFRDTKGDVYLDYLLESEENERDGAGLHASLREHPELAPAYMLQNLFEQSPDSLLSGHLADLTSAYQTSGLRHLFLMDKYDRNSVLDEHERFMIKLMFGNGIIPVDAEARLIDPFPTSPH